MRYEELDDDRPYRRPRHTGALTSRPMPPLLDEHHELTAAARAVLDFERRYATNPAGAKEHDIRCEFDCSATRYYQRLNQLIDAPAALVAEPRLVNRLRRIREERAARRSAPRTEGVIRP